MTNPNTCPKGHQALRVTNGGGGAVWIDCRECQQTYTCSLCGHTFDQRNERILWLDPVTAHACGARVVPNPRDGGCYGMCPRCHKGPVHMAGGAHWYGWDALRRAHTQAQEATHG